MDFKLKPEPARRSERITVALPLDLHEQLEFYRQRLGQTTTMNYICVEVVSVKWWKSTDASSGA